MLLQRRGERRATINEKLCGVCVYDETRSKDLPRLYTCGTFLYSCTVVHVYRQGRSKERSSSESQNRISAHPDKKYADRPTDGQTHFVTRDI